MNTNRLAKHYGTLSPTERLALIVNAAARGDEQEIGRLRSSAPCEDWRMPHHAHMADRLQRLALVSLMDVLDDTARGLRAVMFANSCKPTGLSNEELMDEYFAHAYHCVTRLRGWRLFAEHNGFDPDWLFDEMPAWETVRQFATVAESVIAQFADAKAEVEARMSKRLGAKVSTFSAEEAADALERYYRNGKVGPADPIDA
jgi:hypothetical protein